jgi:Leucine-rich repeat (LRR) protein
MSQKKLSSARGDAQEEPLLGSLVPRLQAVYLNDNLFTKVLPDTFLNLKKVTQLNLYRNYLTEINFLGKDTMPNLEKLYLEHNRLRRLEGLEYCNRLRELYLGN